jgi:hypothetical protein
VNDGNFEQTLQHIARLSADDGAVADLLEELIDELYRLIEAD